MMHLNPIPVTVSLLMNPSKNAKVLSKWTISNYTGHLGNETLKKHLLKNAGNILG